MPVWFKLKEAAYQLTHDVWSTFAWRRYKADFEQVQAFCLFVGYPRSGHSIVGALLNAHRDAVISHELFVGPLLLRGVSRDELYARILARAAWFNMRGNKGTYDYHVPRQWQGKFATLRVIGDKRGGAMSRLLVRHPDIIEKLRTLVRVPLRVVHVVRNPFDNIAAISISDGRTLEQGIDHYFEYLAGSSALGAFCNDEEVMTIRHEDMIASPEVVLTSLCSFVGLKLYPNYVEDCCRIIFRRPTHTRRRVTWKPEQLAAISDRIRPYPFLDGYGFELEDSPTSNSRAPQVV